VFRAEQQPVVALTMEEIMALDKKKMEQDKKMRKQKQKEEYDKKMKPIIDMI